MESLCEKENHEGSCHRRDWLSGHGIDLAAIRNATGPTQVELAAKLGVGQAAVSKIERQREMLMGSAAHSLPTAALPRGAALAKGRLGIPRMRRRRPCADLYS